MTGGWFSSFYDIVMVAADRLGLSRRRSSLGRGARGRVLEIGAGTGLEFRHYAAGAEVYAIEPDVAMARRAAVRRLKSAAAITLVVADARALPFEAGVFDTAVSALAFCTIPEPERAAAEMRRVLCATGTARLLEHVRANHAVIAAAQERLTPLWKRVAGGCHLARPTQSVVRSAGFDVEVVHASFDGVLVELVARPRGVLVAVPGRNSSQLN